LTFDMAAVRAALIERTAEIAVALLGEPNRALLTGRKAGTWFHPERDPQAEPAGGAL
jgi:hypothetical protein